MERHPIIKGCLLLIIGIKCEMKGVARQPLWDECNCNLEASEFFALKFTKKYLKFILEI